MEQVERFIQTRKRLLGWALVGALVSGWLFLVGAGGTTSAAQARQLVKEGAMLVDVRTSQEFMERHIPGAVNIPVHQLQQRIAELPQKDRPIVLYCHSGNRSARAARQLNAAGYTSVHDLGAIDAWFR